MLTTLLIGIVLGVGADRLLFPVAARILFYFKYRILLHLKDKIKAKL